MQTTITILGAGYVGLSTAVLLANANTKVYLVEPNKERRETIQSGKSFFYEHGLNPLLQSALANRSLLVTDSYKESVPYSSVVFSCVGTPDNPDGSSNLRYVFTSAEETLQYAQKNLIYVQKSTVPVGTGKRIEELFAKEAQEKTISYISNPEFLREGTAISDTLFFDRVVVGGSNKVATDTVLDLYRNLEENREHIAQLADISTSSRNNQYIATSLNSAELIKVTSNAFLALKISFANSIAILADKADADVVEVMDAVGADYRIGRAFLNAGRGYGGGCFPKDVSGLISSALEYGVDLGIMEAAKEQNHMMPGYIVDRIKQTLDDSLEGKKVAVLGLSFKAGTSDVRKSPGVAIANKLQLAGAQVTTYDPEAMEEAAVELYRGISEADSVEQAITGAEAVIIATEWPIFLDYPAQAYLDLMSGAVLFDAVNQYDYLEAASAGLHYVGVGRNA
ncbi:MAG: UDP-glucose dehydrogenase family protein [Candidatus Saccharimonadales bacterium]